MRPTLLTVVCVLLVFVVLLLFTDHIFGSNGGS